MKVLHLTTVHPNDDIRIYHKEVKSTSEYYQTMLIAQEKNPFEKEEDGFFALKNVNSRWNRILLQKEAFKIVRQTKPDLVHIHDPELVFLCLLLKTLRCRIIWDIHEDFPKQITKKQWIPSLFRKPVSGMASLLEQTVASFFDALIVATPSIADKFRNHRRMCIVRNYPILKEFAGDFENKSKNDLQFIYVGGLSKERGIYEMSQAIQKVNQKYAAKLVIGGRFVAHQDQEEILNNSFIDYRGWMDRKQIASSYSTSIAGIVALHATPNHLESLPIKMFEYMAAGLPIIASDFPLWRSIVDKYECGLLVNPESPEEIQEAMIWIVENPEKAYEMGVRGRQAVEEELNWDVEFAKLLEMYQNLEKEIKK